jgi:hypothetical protein
LLLCELGERCEAAGLPPAVPETEQRRALIACAWYDPAASTARFLARCEVDCCAALRDYFAYLARDPALRWDDGTLRVIDTAAERRLWEELLTYLRAILPQLPAHSTARRQCRARIRSLGAGARG